jgi:YYY domain-containing protein
MAGLAAVALMLLLGNLYQVRQLVRYLPEVAEPPVQVEKGSTDLKAAISGLGRVLSGEAQLPGDKGRWYFGPSRPILHDGPDTPIAEFPLFTFLYGDLHPHLLVMPVLLAALGWILARLLRPGQKLPRQEQAAFWLAGGLIIGMLRPGHTWDYPTLLGLAVVALLWDGLRRQREWSRQNVARLLARPALLAVLSVILYQPFNHWFGTAYSSLEIWKGERTPLGDYLTVHGIFLFILVSYLLLLSAPWLQTAWQKVKAGPIKALLSTRWDSALLFIAVLVAAEGLWLAKYQVMVVSVPLLAWLALLTFRKDRRLDEIILLALFAAGLGATMIVEVVVLKGDVGRANMLFRYYNQAWCFFSLAGAGALAALFSSMRSWRPAARIAWSVPMILLVAGGLLYPVTAIPKKIADRWPEIANPPHMLDGAEFMLGEAGSGDAVNPGAVYDDEGRKISLASDYAGIKFLQENAVGTPVIVEAQTVEYRWGSRYSIYTGLPAVVGWSWHVRQHNSILSGSLVENRIKEVVNFYSTPELEAAQTFLNRYNVEYIVVGDLERGYYPVEGLDKFTHMVENGQLVEAFSRPANLGRLVIYQVVK